MMTREELNTEIVVAITVFRAAKREELVKAAHDAWDAYDMADEKYDVWVAASDALKAYDKENT
jgi:hypothetical protein